MVTCCTCTMQCRGAKTNPLFGVAPFLIDTQHRSSARIISSGSVGSVTSATGPAVRHTAFAQALTTGIVHARLRTVRFHELALGFSAFINWL